MAVIGMPFTGKWAWNVNVNGPWTDDNSSHPSVHHTPGGGDWATDIYAAEGTAVKLKVGYASAGLSFSWASSSTSCGTSTRLNVLVGGTNVGWLYFAHLKDAVTTGNITNGMTLGTVHNWGGCNPGTHVHVEFHNTTHYSCYVDHGNPGALNIAEGDGLGILGSGNTSARQACSDVPSGSAPVETRPTVSNTIPWNFTVLEGDSGAVSHQDGDIGKGAAVTTYNGSQQAFYYDATGGNLRHAWRVSGGSWNMETLDGAGGSGRMDGNVGINPSVAVYGDSIQVYYYDADNGNLRHAWASSTVGWQFETLDGDSGAISHFSGNVGSVSKVVTFGSTLQIFYPNLDTGDLRHAWADANGWHFENLDGDAGSIAGQVGGWGPAVGSSLAAMVVNGTTIQLFYYQSAGDNLRHAWYDTTTGWHFENLDGDSGAVSGYDGSVGQNPSVTYNGSLQVFYFDASGGSLRHAWTDANGWHFEALDGANSSIGPNRYVVGLYSSAISGDGVNIQLVYYDQRWSNLRHAWTDSSGWHFENLDGLGGGPAGRVPWDVGQFPVLTSFGGSLNVFYYDILYGNLRLVQSQ